MSSSPPAAGAGAPTTPATAAAAAAAISSMPLGTPPLPPLTSWSVSALRPAGPIWLRMPGSSSCTLLFSPLPVSTYVLLVMSALTFGLEKWMMLLSSLKMFTSSTPGSACTLSFLSVAASFLSSTAETLCTAVILRRTVPLPPMRAAPVAEANFALSFSPASEQQPKGRGPPRGAGGAGRRAQRASEG